MRKLLFGTLIVITTLGCESYTWVLQESAPSFRGKQDDIHFIDSQQGWYCNGSGQIFKTVDGGTNWELVYEQPGTFFRCIGFLDSLNGFVGNVGMDYFPGVEDSIPLYRTRDGGLSWEPVEYDGPTVKGLCAIEIIEKPYVNHGVLDYNYEIIAGGRVGSPAFLVRSTDGGETWTSEDMSEHCAYILDINFHDENTGFICAGSNTDFTQSHALILKTTNGGETWQNVYESERPYEITWKGSWPTEEVGYVTIQSYDPDSTMTKRYVAKTIDGGDTWAEMEMTDNYTVREFGIGFINEDVGWVGDMSSLYQTTNGGVTWKKLETARVINKIRVIETSKGATLYAIGTNVWKMDVTIKPEKVKMGGDF